MPENEIHDKTVELESSSFINIERILHTTATFSTEAIAAGITIGDYKILSFIDKGANGIVYKAQRITDGKEVAIKLLNTINNDANFTERFIREAKIMARFDHPHILTIFDTGTYAENRYYIAMELIDGLPMDKILKSKHKIDQDACLKYMNQIALALSDIHKQGLIHRDIKPANIMINQDDNAILMDFGLVKAEDESLETQKLTREGLCVGTPLYMPPEQFQTKMKLTSSSDIYALGITFYEALTGQNPFNGSSIQQIVTQKMRGKLDPPKRHNPQISAPLNTLIMDMLCKSPQSRPINGETLNQRLRNIDQSPLLDSSKLRKPTKEKSNQQLINPQDLYKDSSQSNKPTYTSIAVAFAIIVVLITLIGLFLIF